MNEITGGQESRGIKSHVEEGINHQGFQKFS